MKNTLAYQGKYLIMAVKSFIGPFLSSMLEKYCLVIDAPRKVSLSVSPFKAFQAKTNICEWGQSLFLRRTSQTEDAWGQSYINSTESN